MTVRQQVLAAVGVGALVGTGVWMTYRATPAPTPTVRVPELSAVARAGQLAYQRRCASCHGEIGQGTASGPPLVHAIYRPGHHAEVAFELAVRRGVRAHHWQLGDMPPQPTVPAAEVTEITRFVRELQQANGVE
jgi:mono/diheme cytochrome c family protein